MNPSRLKYRSEKLERLDIGDFTPQEYQLWEKEMRLIHSFLGERRAMRKSLVSEIRKNRADYIKILDVGAGSGELSARLLKEFEERRISVVGADASERAVLSMREKGIQGVRCDALKLPFADGSFDYVYSTLFLHHLSDRNAIALIREMKRIARQKFFIIDLERQFIPYLLFKTLGGLIFQPFTRDDGSLSILRSFNRKELENIAVKAGVKNICIRRSYLNRLILSGTN
ncbi:MAG: hypothetical protein DMF62_03005 [Acidobacteria bacterium]|nr:MAG: hypothetical protein DMF62_03005 [Acidobacteriota bacterium]